VPAAHGATPEEITVAADDCPSAADVARELAEILPKARIRVVNAAEALVRVRDLGSRYEVVVGATRREIGDEARRCDERARTAAVVAGVAIEPPSGRPAAPSGALTSVTLDLAGLADAGLAGDGIGTLPGVGGMVRATVARGWAGVSFGVAALAPATLGLATGQVQVLRIPLDVGLRASWRRARWEVAADFGLAAALVRFDGQALLAAQQSWRIELGARLGASLRYWAWKGAAPFVAIQAVAVPLPAQLSVAPEGVVATMPLLWVSALAGVSVKFN
jgi:hypothetical protein